MSQMVVLEFIVIIQLAHFLRVHALGDGDLKMLTCKQNGDVTINMHAHICHCMVS